jgi:glyoxylase-like metal-dependent hydrolase (beta-lactamase superfamily II)
VETWRAWLTAAIVLCLSTIVREAHADDANAKARAIIDRAVEAMGGKQAVLGVKSIRRALSEGWMDVGQGQHPWTGVPDVDHLPVHFPIAVVNYVDYAAGTWFESERFDDGPGDYAVSAVAWSGKAGFEKVRYTDEKPYFRLLAAEDITAQGARRLRRYPEGILRMALARAETLVALGDNAVAFTDPAGTRVSFFFDPQTHLLARSEVDRDSPILGDTTADTLYTDYRKVGRLMVPHAIVDRVAGLPSRKWALDAVEIDAIPPPGAFEAPRDFIATRSAPDEPTLNPRGNGVFEILGPYNVMFAVFADHVLLSEAPVNEAYTQKCLKLIDSVAPRKPVRVVASHFHYDHIGGARTLVAHSIPIATTPDAVTVIRKAVTAPRPKHPDLLSKTPRAPQLETIEQKHVYEDATQRVEIYDFGPAPHVAQILVAYFPRTKTLHVADLLDTLTPEMVIPGVDTMAMIAKIKEYRLDVTSIVPVHGVPVTMDDLNRGLAIRARHVPGTPLDARP